MGDLDSTVTALAKNLPQLREAPSDSGRSSFIHRADVQQEINLCQHFLLRPISLDPHEASGGAQGMSEFGMSNVQVADIIQSLLSNGFFDRYGSSNETTIGRAFLKYQIHKTIFKLS